MCAKGVNTKADKYLEIQRYKYVVWKINIKGKANYIWFGETHFFSLTFFGVGGQLKD